MKLQLLGIFGLFTSLLACTKMKTYCWKCTTTQTMFYSNGSQTIYGTSQNEACGLTEAEARNYEKLGSQEAKASDGTFVTARKCTR